MEDLGTRLSEDKTIGPGIPHKLAFALRVRISSNRSRFLQVDQEPGAAQPDYIGTHVLLNTHAYSLHSCILIPQVVFTATHCLL